MSDWWSDAEGAVLDDRYELGPAIGRGGAGVVHRAWDRVRCRAVAVKLLAPGSTALGSRTGRQEADVLAALDHPQLVALHDVLTTADGVALVMELVDGPALADRLDDGALPLDDAALVLRDVAAGLAHAHARGIVHRDVKPGNVLLRQDDGVVTGAALADFGIARFAEATRTTVAATIVGTLRYLSPEQIRGERVTAAADVYSLGLTMLAAVTGRPAFPGSDAESLGGRLVRTPDVPEALPSNWRGLLSAMTALEPEARPGAAEVATAAARLGRAPLLPVAAAAPTLAAVDEKTRAIDAPTLATVAPRRRRRIPRFAALASTAVASVGVLLLVAAPVGLNRAVPAGSDRIAAPASSAAAAAPSTAATAATAPRTDQVSAGSGTSSSIREVSTVRRTLAPAGQPGAGASSGAASSGARASGTALSGAANGSAASSASGRSSSSGPSRSSGTATAQASARTKAPSGGKQHAPKARAEAKPRSAAKAGGHGEGKPPATTESGHAKAKAKGGQAKDGKGNAKGGQGKPKGGKGKH